MFLVRLADAGAKWSGKRDSNPRPPAWKAGALPLSYSRVALSHVDRRTRAACPLAASSGSLSLFDRPPAPRWWRGEDLNPRRRSPADLQSAPFGHLGTSPCRPWTPVELAPPTDGRRWLRKLPGARPDSSRWSWRRESNPRPAAYKAAALPLSYASKRQNFILFGESASVNHFFLDRPRQRPIGPRGARPRPAAGPPRG